MVFFKVFFMLKYIKIIFFYFFKNYFLNQHIKTNQKIKFLTKKIKIFRERGRVLADVGSACFQIS